MTADASSPDLRMKVGELTGQISEMKARQDRLDDTLTRMDAKLDKIQTTLAERQGNFRGGWGVVTMILAILSVVASWSARLLPVSH